MNPLINKNRKEPVVGKKSDRRQKNYLKEQEKINKLSKGIDISSICISLFLLFLLRLKVYIVYVIEMTATAERFNNSSAVTFKNEDNNSKKRGITFGIQSAQSIPA